MLSRLVPCAALFCGFTMRWEVIQAFLPKEEKQLLAVTVGRLSPDHVLQGSLDPHLLGSHLLLAPPLPG